MLRKIVRILLRIAAVLGVMLASAVLLFWLLVIQGWSPTLQRIWVCSAMRTMSHQYLATTFIPADTIRRIMEENYVDDTGYDSVILTFDETEESTPPDPVLPEEETDLPAVETEETAADTDAPAVGVPETHAPETEPPVTGQPETEASESDSPETEAPETEPAAPYPEEGYEMLEEGLYLKPVSGLGWRGFVMLVEDPLRVKLTDTSMQYTCGENVMTMTKNAGAVAGINGGGFRDGPNYDSNGGIPAGLLIEDGVLICPTEPDDGTVYNMIGLNIDGALVLRHCTAQWALDNGIVSAVSFAPFFVVNGEGLVKNGSGGWGIAPRTAIGQRKTGEILFLVIDGRQVDWSLGCDLDVLQKVMLEENAVNAAMLDGGSSTAMVYDGNYINRPSLGHERWINNAFVVMP